MDTFQSYIYINNVTSNGSGLDLNKVLQVDNKENVSSPWAVDSTQKKVSATNGVQKWTKSPGVRVIGGRIYYSENGKTFHQVCVWGSLSFSLFNPHFYAITSILNSEHITWYRCGPEKILWYSWHLAILLLTTTHVHRTFVPSACSIG